MERDEVMKEILGNRFCELAPAATLSAAMGMDAFCISAVALGTTLV
jgi:hypothetical protein